MQCPFCRTDEDRVVDSRTIGDGNAIRRRRKCLACGKRFTTYERTEEQPRVVIKKDSSRESFSRKKILDGKDVRHHLDDIEFRAAPAGNRRGQRDEDQTDGKRSHIDEL